MNHSGTSLTSRLDSSRRSLSTIACWLLLILLLTSCHGNKSNPVSARPDPEPEICPAEQWDFDTGGYYAYTHDCEPFEGVHFTIYSDGSSLGAKQQLAGLAEGIFNQLVPEFEIEDIQEELDFTGDYTYYIYADQNHDVIRAMGYRNGFFIGAIDCVTHPDYYTRDPWWYSCILKHELTHVFQFTLTGCPRNSACPYWLGVWFREGQAVYMSGWGQGVQPVTLDEFCQWREDESHANPISIHRWTDFPDPDRGGEYYRMFGLAYAYLVDQEHGHGASISDMRDMFQLMKEGQGFMEAFQEVMGMTVQFFEDDFYRLMEEYLGKTGGERGEKDIENLNLKIENWKFEGRDSRFEVRGSL